MPLYRESLVALAIDFERDTNLVSFTMTIGYVSVISSDKERRDEMELIRKIVIPGQSGIEVGAAGIERVGTADLRDETEGKFRAAQAGAEFIATLIVFTWKLQERRNSPPDLAIQNRVPRKIP